MVSIPVRIPVSCQEYPAREDPTALRTEHRLAVLGIHQPSGREPHLCNLQGALPQTIDNKSMRSHLLRGLHRPGAGGGERSSPKPSPLSLVSDRVKHRLRQRFKQVCPRRRNGRPARPAGGEVPQQCAALQVDRPTVKPGGSCAERVRIHHASLFIGQLRQDDHPQKPGRWADRGAATLSTLCLVMPPLQRDDRYVHTRSTPIDLM